jgi:ankyrin repeat protein
LEENYTALHVAVQSGKAIVVETLLGHGADVHVQGGPLGETALHIASGLTGPDARACAEMLLKSGAEANVPQQVFVQYRFGKLTRAISER